MKGHSYSNRVTYSFYIVWFMISTQNKGNYRSKDRTSGYKVITSGQRSSLLVVLLKCDFYEKRVLNPEVLRQKVQSMKSSP